MSWLRHISASPRRLSAPSPQLPLAPSRASPLLSSSGTLHPYHPSDPLTTPAPALLLSGHVKPGPPSDSRKGPRGRVDQRPWKATAGPFRGSSALAKDLRRSPPSLRGPHRRHAPLRPRPPTPTTPLTLQRRTLHLLPAATDPVGPPSSRSHRLSQVSRIPLSAQAPESFDLLAFQRLPQWPSPLDCWRV